VGCETYRLDGDGSFQWLDAEAHIDLGAIAQGYVAACLAETLRVRGIDRFLINISGDIVVEGERPGGGPWRIGVQDPRRPDALVARLPMRWTAVTTSGDYEQYFVENGQRYHHVFDPATGYPSRGAISVSVFSEDPVAADCYATALFVLGPERGLAFVEARPDLGALFVRETPEGKAEMLWSTNLEQDFGAPPSAAATP
jgi:thiamine biosynthesis lipoprotein